MFRFSCDLEQKKHKEFYRIRYSTTEGKGIRIYPCKALLRVTSSLSWSDPFCKPFANTLAFQQISECPVHFYSPHRSP